jgi:uncharacterized surface protein with fasciclin (FAS1) repeats
MRSIVILSALALIVGCADAKNLANAAGVDNKDLKAAENVAAEETKKAADDAPKNIYQTAAYKGMGQLTAMLSKAGLDKTLEGAGPYTVFAPTDEAFNKIPEAKRAELMTDAGLPKLKQLLAYHVVEGTHASADIAKMKSVKTMNGDAPVVVSKDGKVSVGGANVTTADVSATNGVIHVVDSVMMPAGM